MADDLLKSWKVSLGFESGSDGSGGAQVFADALGGAVLKANLLASAVEGMAKAIAGGMLAVSQNFAGVAQLATLTKASADTILGNRVAFQQMGKDQAEADGVLRTVAEQLRKLNSANASYFETLGFHQNKETGEITENLALGQQNLERMTDSQIASYATITGLSEAFLQTEKKHGKEMQAFADAHKRTLASFGIDAKAVADAKTFTHDYNEALNSVSKAYDKMMMKIEKALDPYIVKLNGYIKDNAKEINAAFDDMGASIRDDVIKPLFGLNQTLDKLDSKDLSEQATSITDYAHGVVGFLGGVKDVLDVLAGAFRTIGAVGKFVRETAAMAQGPADAAQHIESEAERRYRALNPTGTINRATPGAKHFALGSANVSSLSVDPDPIKLSVGGAPVQSGNPMPIRIERIDADLGSAFGGSSGGGGASGSYGASQPGRPSSGGQGTSGTGATTGEGTPELSGDYKGLVLAGQQAVSGGPAELGLLDFAREQQKAEGGRFNSINDHFHHGLRYRSAHTEGLAFDENIPGGDYNAARARARARLNARGMIEGRDYWIEPGTRDHLHVGFKSSAAAAKYHRTVAPDTTSPLVNRTDRTKGAVSVVNTEITVHMAGISDPHAAVSALASTLHPILASAAKPAKAPATARVAALSPPSTSRHEAAA